MAGPARTGRKGGAEEGGGRGAPGGKLRARSFLPLLRQQEGLDNAARGQNEVVVGCDREAGCSTESRWNSRLGAAPKLS